MVGWADRVVSAGIKVKYGRSAGKMAILRYFMILIKVW